MKRKVFFLFFNQRLRELKRLKGQSCVESKNWFFMRAASLRCCFSSQLNAIKMFNLSFFSPSWRVSAAAVRWRWRWRQDEREIHIRRWWREKRAVTYHQRVTVRSHSDRPIWYLYFLMFLNNRWNASTSNVMLMYLKCFLDVVISFFFVTC